MRKRSIMFGGRRRALFVDAKQQLWFALTLFLYAIMAIVLFLRVTLLPDASLVENPVGESFLPLILQDFLGLCIQNSWSMLFTLMFLACCAVLFSQQIFGPIRRFENAMVEKNENSAEIVHCGLRRTDYFQRFSIFLDEFLNKSEAAEESDSESADS